MDTALVPATGGGAVVPAAPALPASLGGGTVAVPNNSASREMAKPAGGNVPVNLSADSVLDLLGREMAGLNTLLEQLGETLVPLDRTAEVIDQVVTNVDERSKLYQAPAATRSATDAASAVGSHMADMTVQVREHTLRTQALNAAAFVALQNMRDVQDRQRQMGAGPRLLRNAGN